MSLKTKELTQVTANSLEPLMAAEARLWLEKLGWDYSQTQEYIKTYIDLSLLPGLVLLDGDRPVAYAYMVLDDNRAVIGNIFALPSEWEKGYEVVLAETLTGVLENSRTIHRVEAQIILFYNVDIDSAFRSAGYSIYERSFLTLDLHSWNGVRPKPDGVYLAKWRDSMIPEASELIYESYRGGIDASFSTSFSRRDKCEQFVYNLVRRSGCGVFLPSVTTVAFDEGGKMAGVVIASRLAKNSGHLPQISVLPSLHGTGIGAYLVFESLRHFQKAGYDKVSLTVTKLNEKADSWYRRIGFEQTLSFNAYLWER